MNYFVTNDDVSVTKCIDFFEAGARKVYILNEQGEYSGYAITRESLKNIWTDGTFFESAAIEEEENERHINHCQWSDFLPVPDVFWKKKIFVASAANDELHAFFLFWSVIANVCLLSEENLEEAVYCEDSLILYTVDIYPNCHKISLKDFYESLTIQKIHDASRGTFFSNDYVHLPVEEATNEKKLVDLMDRGYQTVFITDADDKFYGVVTQSGMRGHFPYQKPPIWQNLFLRDNSDLEVLKLTASAGFFGSEREELPVIGSDGHIVSCAIRGRGIDGYGYRQFIGAQTLYWELISEDVVTSVIPRGSRIMISSDCPGIHGFCERFGLLYQIDEFDGYNLGKIDQEKIDWLLYEADIWPQLKIAKQNIRQLFADLLAEELRRYFSSQNIRYLYADVSEGPADFLTQLENAAPKSGAQAPSPKWGGIREDYIVPSDNVTGEEFQVVCGHRQDCNYFKQADTSVAVFGPCIALGLSASEEKETIEAVLQQALQRHNIQGNIINSGTFGTDDIVFNDINNLYYIMSSHFRQGDIIIQFGQTLWKSRTAFDLHEKYQTRDVFNLKKYKGIHCFRDYCPAHMTTEGYKVWGEFLSERIEEKIKVNREFTQDKKNVAPFADRLSSQRISNKQLEKYLEYISSEGIKRNAGAIVMNANPFTKGHRYLVEEALKQVDYLYVFVLEEERSAFSFEDRYKLVQMNLEDLERVRVLPSGKFVISSLTFPEYFEKEKKQNTKVVPAQDISFFGEAIAPALGITKRFVGEEPFDNITRQYNEAMARYLPLFGVELIEISRKAVDGETINATAVRKAIKNGNEEICRKFLTPVTFHYLFDK